MYIIAFKNTILNYAFWNICIKVYIGVILAWFIYIISFAYVHLIMLIYCMHNIYEQELDDYNKLCPIATSMFTKHYRIYFHGLVLFWFIGATLLFLAFLIFPNKITLTIIYCPVLIGFILFTFYPYYITKRKVEELKFRTINDIKYGANINRVKTNLIDIIRFVQDTPNTIGNDILTTLISSITALVSIITLIVSVF